ncbi:MAG: SDR family NAD(P)-dependent oxidoreductase [Armatimonadota bacterium]
MDLGIRDKKVLIVGASKGIGRAIAVAYANEGCKTTLISRDKGLLESLANEIGGEEAGHSYYAADMLADGVPTETAKLLISQHSCFDIVVHNVGGPLEVRNPLSPVSEWRKVWQYNAGIAIEMNEFLIPPMIEQGWGRVIHISSISAQTLRGCPPYASSKAYLNAYTQTLGRAIANTGVVVSAIMPGAVAFENSYWDIRMKEHPEIADDFLRHHQAVGRMGTPEEIANFALFMGSQLVTFAQSSIIPVDGANM